MKKELRNNPILGILNNLYENRIKPRKPALFLLVRKYAEYLPIKTLCRYFSVSRSGYYKWYKRSQKDHPYEDIIRAIRNIKHAHKFESYGYRKMHRILEKSFPLLGEKKVYRLMKENGLLSSSIHSRKKSIFRRALKSYPNLVNRHYFADAPNQILCTDITELITSEGKVFLCTVLDLYDRSILAFQIYKDQSVGLVKATIRKALEKIGASTSTIPVIFHSDRGTQFVSKQIRDLISNSNGQASYSKSGTPGDNAAMESFFGSLKKEFVYLYDFDNIEEVNLGISAYVDFYNKIRIHSFNDYRSPYEKRAEYYASLPYI